MDYLLDTNIFIQAKNEYYAFDLCPGFWHWLEQQNQAGMVFSIYPVKRELEKGKDALADWAKQQGGNFFLDIDQPTNIAMGNISAWVCDDEQQYRDFAQRDFLSGADPFLVAYAQAHNHTVVSHEIYVEGERKKIKIPAVCHAFSVPCIRTFEMLRKENASFILPP